LKPAKIQLRQAIQMPRFPERADPFDMQSLAEERTPNPCDNSYALSKPRQAVISKAIIRYTAKTWGESTSGQPIAEAIITTCEGLQKVLKAVSRPIERHSAKVCEKPISVRILCYSKRVDRRFL